MGTPFQDACAAASGAVDTVYGEPWVYMPMATGDANTRRSPDPERAIISIVAAFIDPYARAFSGPARKQGVRVEHPGHASSRPIIDIALAQLTYDPRRGDRVTRSTDGSLWQVAEVRPDGTGRAELELNRLTGAPS
jgi:hypothetical protein